MTLHPPTDAAVWARARDGDEHAFAELFDRHARTVYNYCFRRTADWSAAAEDLASVVFGERGIASAANKEHKEGTLIYSTATGRMALTDRPGQPSA
jgi:DNA-directed RNA polymerase specialized sigma24 family protein